MEVTASHVCGITKDVLFPTRELDLVARLEDAAIVAADDYSADPGTIAGKVLNNSDGLRANKFLLWTSKLVSYCTKIYCHLGRDFSVGKYLKNHTVSV